MGLKNIASTFFMIGFLASHIIPAQAVAVNTSSTNLSPIAGTIYHGEYYDEGTATRFDLFSPEEYKMTNDEALESYWRNLNNGTVLDKRGFYDCSYSGRRSGLKVAACGTAHAIGAFVSATGAAAAGGYINSELQEAFNGKRDNQSPRSICITKDGDMLCTSWANYSTGKLQSGESGDIEGYALKCGQNNGSAEFKGTTTDGGIIYICVSNRAKGCGANVCGQ